jgi:hypothetical protein
MALTMIGASIDVRVGRGTCDWRGCGWTSVDQQGMGVLLGMGIRVGMMIGLLLGMCKCVCGRVRPCVCVCVYVYVYVYADGWKTGGRGVR